MTTSLRSITAMLLLAAIWGLSIPVTKLALETLPPLTLTALRFAIAVPLFLPVFFGKHRLSLHELVRVAVLGVLGVGVGQVAQAYGVAGTSASIGTVISATIPLFVVIFAAKRLGQSVAFWQRVGLLSAFVGIAFVALDGQTTVTPASTATGIFWMLVSSITIAFYYVWSVELAEKYGTGKVAAWSTLFGFIAITPFAVWEMLHIPIQLTLAGILAGAYLGVLVTVVGLFLWIKILRSVPASTAASVQYLQPVIGVIASAIVFGDSLGLLFAAGVGLVLAGLALTVSSRSQGPTGG